MRLIGLAALAMLVAATATKAADTEVSTYSGGVSGNADLRAAQTMVEAERFAEAIPKLEALAVSAPANPDVFNLLGFSYRKTGDLDGAATAYETALRLNPRHLGALEYQGELFLLLDQPEKAEANLAQISGQCFFGCSEEDELEAAIAAWRTQAGG